MSLDNEIYGSDEPRTIEISETDVKQYEEDKKLKEAILALYKNKNFKVFRKAFIDDSLVNLGLNFGVQQQMKGIIASEIEARRIFKDFLDMAIQRGFDAEEILNGVEK